VKLLNFQLQTDIERLSPDKPTQYFKEHLRSILQDTSTSYFKKCDYVGLSLAEVQNKIDSISRDIQELGELKRNLAQALNIAKQITAEIFMENGIDRIDGNIISSLTLTKESVRVKDEVKIIDENALLTLGYVKHELDLEAVEQALKGDKRSKISKFAEVLSTRTITPARVKINQKRETKTKITEISPLDEPFAVAV
jgi:hypothetical protein